MVEHAHDHGLLLFAVSSWLQSIFPLWLLKDNSVQQTIVIERFGVICPWDGVCTLWLLVPLTFSRSHWSLLIVHVLWYVVIKQLHSSEVLFTGWLSWWGSAHIDNIYFPWLNCPCSLGVIMLVVILSVHIGAHNSKILRHIIFTVLVWEFETLCVVSVASVLWGDVSRPPFMRFSCLQTRLRIQFYSSCHLSAVALGW